MDNIWYYIIIAVLAVAILVLVFLLIHDRRDLKRIQEYQRRKQMMNHNGVPPYPPEGVPAGALQAPMQGGQVQPETVVRTETNQTEQQGSGNVASTAVAEGTGLQETQTEQTPTAILSAPEAGDTTVTLTQAPVLQDTGDMTAAPRFSEDIEKYLVRTAGTLRIGKLHGVGKRENQQDSMAYSDPDNLDLMDQKGYLAIVGDGMGGLSNGAEISQMVVTAMLEYFDTRVTGEEDPADALLNMVEYANRQVCDHIGEDKWGTSGSTVVAALWRDHKIHWISVGDSSIFLYQNGMLQRVNDLHNFGAELDELAALGQITEEEAKNDRQRAALTSYMGMGPLKHISQSSVPIELKSGDRLILASDGIYSAVSMAEISDLLRFDVEVAAMKLRFLIEEKEKRNQDNYTAMIIEDHYM